MSDIVISIIVSTRDRADELAKTVASIGACAIPAEMPAELIVVDNGSTDATARVLAEARIDNMAYVPLSEPRPGKSRALNKALGAARGRVFLFTDDDVRVGTNWVTGMAGPILAGKADGVCGGVRPAPHLVINQMSETEQGLMVSSEHTPESELADPFLIGVNMACRADAIDKIGGFDPEIGPGTYYAACEDVLFSLQFKMAGYRIRPAMDVIVEHHFDPARISREGIMNRPRLEGRASAYMRHHWGREMISLPRVRLWKHQMEFLWKKMVRRRSRGAEMACPDWELSEVRDVEFHRQYVKECKRHRNYAPGNVRKLFGDVDSLVPPGRHTTPPRMPVRGAAVASESR